MTRDQLEHAVRAACDVARVSELIVIGSQAILGAYPDAPDRLRQSMEVDLVLANSTAADAVDGILGEESLFHRTHGFYAQGMTIEGPLLPAGWRERLILVRNANTRHCSAWCLEPHDLAASKLSAFRDKDRDFVRVMLLEKLVDADELRRRAATLPCGAELRDRILAWLDATGRELRKSGHR